MNQPTMVKCGEQLINTQAVACAHWEPGRVLWIHLIGGRFTSFKGEHAQLVWNALSPGAIDLETGEVTAPLTTCGQQLDQE